MLFIHTASRDRTEKELTDSPHQKGGWARAARRFTIEQKKVAARNDPSIATIVTSTPSTSPIWHFDVDLYRQLEVRDNTF